jgi:ATP-binding cassette subfamily B protein
MTLGQLLAFAAFIGYLYPPVRKLGQLGLTLTAATAGAQRLNEILDAEPSVTDPADPVRAWPVRGWVGFHGVSFRYPGATRESLDDVTFTASPGELVIITGASGVGKSTLSKLLTRFYDPAAGVITPTCPRRSAGSRRRRRCRPRPGRPCPRCRPRSSA